MAKKRGSGEGSISWRKGGGWTAQYAVYTAEGRKRSKGDGVVCDTNGG
jgi:integrase